MQVKIFLSYNSIWMDKVIETVSGEILRPTFPNGDLRHDCWFDELDEERRRQILEQVPEVAA